jgi:2,4-dienoyl-CoA reductase-like NADH-dependent reductase (Old Yellow Enzyme family)
MALSSSSQPLLFSRFALGALELPNRIVIAPMCQYSAQQGNATPWHLMHLGAMTASGAGLLILEATAVEADGRISPGDLGLWNDANEAALANVLESLRAYSSMPIGIQLGHAGRKASSAAPWNGGQQLSLEEGGWLGWAPSAIAHGAGELAPQMIDKAGIARIRKAFAEAAQRAERIGLQAIELHAAHGYLLHQFLSPIANQRGDEYGGALKNRLRMVLEVFSATRAAVSSRIPVGVRFSATDWVEGGWDLEQSVELGLALKAEGCDFLHVSSGGISPAQKIVVGPGYQVGMAARIRAETEVTTIAVGLITEPEQAQAVLESGQADLVALARAMLYNPRWPWHAAAKLGAQVEAPKQYWRSQPQGLSKLFDGLRLGQR